MRTRLKLKPGQRSTKKLQAMYGDRLVCVRYRYDLETGRCFKTIELVDEKPGHREIMTRSSLVALRT